MTASRTGVRERPGPSLFNRTSRRVTSTSLHLAALGSAVAGVGMCASAAVEQLAGGPHTLALAVCGVAVTVVGGLVWAGTRPNPQPSPGDAFMAVTATWLIVSLVGGLPFWVTASVRSVNLAVFESVSGFTATGATILSPVSAASDGVLFWRSLTQWYGGMGMVVLAVAVLPFLGVGGLELIGSEAPGPTTDRLAPRVRETARRLWIVYLGITVVAATALLATGLSPYDAVTHTFTAVATGGFSRYDASIGYFHSVAVELILIATMIAGAVNFTLHWKVLTTRRLGAYARSTELRSYALWLVTTALVVAVVAGIDGGMLHRLRLAAFTVVSYSTTTGFGVTDTSQWASSAQLVLLSLMVVGGMAGSTAGAIKMLRTRVMFRIAAREVRQARHPRAVLPLRVGGELIAEPVVGNVAGFVQLYALTAVAGLVALCLTGLDVVSSAGVVATSMGGVGPGLGQTVGDFTALSDPALIISDVLMIAGRVEIVPMILAVVLVPGRLFRRTRTWSSSGQARPVSGSGTRSGSADRG